MDVRVFRNIYLYTDMISVAAHLISHSENELSKNTIIPSNGQQRKGQQHIKPTKPKINRKLKMLENHFRE